MNIEYLPNWVFHEYQIFLLCKCYALLPTYSNKTMNNNWFSCIVNQAIR